MGGNVQEKNVRGMTIRSNDSEARWPRSRDHKKRILSRTLLDKRVKEGPNRKARRLERRAGLMIGREGEYCAVSGEIRRGSRRELELVRRNRVYHESNRKNNYLRLGLPTRVLRSLARDDRREEGKIEAKVPRKTQSMWLGVLSARAAKSAT